MPRIPFDKLAAILAVFVVALGCRLSLPYRPHNEGDERIYRALVEQWDAGRGHTLQGHPLLLEPGTDRVQYGQKLFFHPPGGIALFWAGHTLFGERGFLLVELASFALFFFAVIGLAALVIEPFGVVEALLAALLAGFSPILLHVTAHYWLDGPVLALSTLAAVLAMWALRRGSSAWIAVAGVTLGAGALVKPTAFLVVPGLAALAAARRPPSIRQAAIFLACAAATFAPWLIWRWQVMGTPFPGWAGKPTPNLATLNPYVHYVTVIRKPWVYLSLLPRVHATIVPACLLGIAQWGRPALRRLSVSLVAWIAAIVLMHVALGYLGFSKVLRYVILVSPAVIVLFVAQAGAAWRERDRRWVLLGLALVGLVLEIVQGVRTMVFDRDLILPWPFGL